MGGGDFQTSSLSLPYTPPPPTKSQISAIYGVKKVIFNKYWLVFFQASTHYRFWLCAMTVVGEGPPRAAVIQSGVEPVLPDAPRNLALSNIEAFSVMLQFTHGFDGNSSISLWTVQVKF